ncbi:MAG: hypothetical protein IKY33_02045 [Clostridia bacterium]|nr:hypothetical protein [Clostridia bacterium]
MIEKPFDPNAPVEPAKAKAPETPTTRVEQQRKKKQTVVTEFKKDVKFLWLYASVFCLVVLALIGGSYVVQQRIHAEVNEYRGQAETAEQSESQAQSRLSNIQEENKSLKSQLESAKTENETLKAGAKADEALIESGEKIILELQKLLKIDRLLQEGNRAEALEIFESIDSSILPEDSMESYTYYEERLN